MDGRRFFGGEDNKDGWVFLDGRGSQVRPQEMRVSPRKIEVSPRKMEVLSTKTMWFNQENGRFVVELN